MLCENPVRLCHLKIMSELACGVCGRCHSENGHFEHCGTALSDTAEDQKAASNIADAPKQAAALEPRPFSTQFRRRDVAPAQSRVTMRDAFALW